MSDNLDNFVQNLQEEIFEETKKDFGEIAYQRWRNPLYMGAMENPDAHAKVRGNCGDSIEIFLRFEDDRVENASFLTDGCGASGVCGSFASEMAIGKTSDEILEITGETILEKLEGLPEDNVHCAFLAANSLHESVSDYVRKQAQN
ncbi:MAG: iron-sulfur cluster assembly scaffold protein [Desulfobacteraceae bacterium 4572_88]|nr:MAG: iron-sulfur cluster assembly scaffold protein [Desulfobacteraceae bacterium 4572_88]